MLQPLSDYSETLTIDKGKKASPAGVTLPGSATRGGSRRKVRSAHPTDLTGLATQPLDRLNRVGVALGLESLPVMVIDVGRVARTSSRIACPWSNRQNTQT